MIHQQKFGGGDRFKYFSLIKKLRFVGVSEWISAQFRLSPMNTFANVECIHNGFDLETFKPHRTNLREKLGYSDKFIILGPASKWLLPINKHALEYFADNMPPNAVMILFGYSGGELNLLNNVHLAGFTSSRDYMAQLYSIADVMVNCSREDTLSSLNLEAQACGTPIVTYDSTGSKETVDGISSFAVNTGDYKMLFSKMMEIYKNGKKFYSDSCRIYIQRNFDLATNCSKYVALYNELMFSGKK